MNKQSNSRHDFIKLATAGAAGSLVTWNAESYVRIAGGTITRAQPGREIQQRTTPKSL